VELVQVATSKKAATNTTKHVQSRSCDVKFDLDRSYRNFFIAVFFHTHLHNLHQMANKKASRGGRRKGNAATASRCTGALAPRFSLKPARQATEDQPEEAMTGVEETPLSKVDITFSGEQYGVTRDFVSLTIREQCNPLKTLVVLQPLPRRWRSSLRFLPSDLVQ
jgi:hypothetical protein